jgi:hypothetical protein
MAIAADKNASGEFGPVSGALMALEAIPLVRVDFDFDCLNAYPTIPLPQCCSDDLQKK